MKRSALVIGAALRAPARAGAVSGEEVDAARVAEMLRGRGYSFARLEDVLKDEAFALPDGYFGGAGISWLHRWCFALGGKSLVLPGEPQCPEWVMKEAGVDSE